jgi:hypothetical protein
MGLPLAVFIEPPSNHLLMARGCSISTAASGDAMPEKWYLSGIRNCRFLEKGKDWQYVLV